MIGVVPVPQVLQHQDEVRGALDHAGGVDVRRAHRRAAGDMSVERDLAR